MQSELILVVITDTIAINRQCQKIQEPGSLVCLFPVFKSRKT